MTQSTKDDSSIGLVDIAHALPKNTVTSEEIAERHDFDIDFVRNKLGISERRIASDDETTATLGINACRALLARGSINSEELDALIVVTQTPDYLLPHTSALIHEALDLPNTVAAFDINLGCSGFVYGLSVAKAFLMSNGLERALLVTTETYSRIMAPDDRGTAPLFGDGAAATLIGPAPLYEVGRSTFGTKGKQHEALIAKGTGTRPGNREALHMDGRRIFTFMMSEIPGEIDRCLEMNGLEKDDIDLWVFHQASKYMLEMLAKRVGIDRDKVAVVLDDVGNTTSSTIPIALERSVLETKTLPQKIYISGFGVGLSWASSVLTRTGQ